MQIPFVIINKIESLIKGIPLNTLAKESERLSHSYRNTDHKNYFNSLASDHQRLAYLTCRFPATYAAVYQVLKEAIERCGQESITSLLDIGAGPGTVLLAASETSLPLSSATLVERDAGFIALGKQLMEGNIPFDVKWIWQDITKQLNVDPHDLVVASYSLNELSEKARSEILNTLWKLTKKILIIIEPGTKAAFEILKQMRESLILSGAHLVAPCPHSNACPLKEKDWCHFSARVERSSLHRKIKEATLNYEDEKFSYLIFSRNQIEPVNARILRHPFKGKGFIKLQLCSKEGIEEKTITKKNKLHYSYAKSKEWGDNHD